MTLAPHHYAMLHTGSAITDAVLTARGYVSFDHPDEVRDLGFSKTQARTAPVLAIPLWGVHGQQTSWQIRPDSPRQMKDGKIFKYETMKGGRLQLDVHPSVQPLLGDPHVPLWITEGVRKGDALVSQGACTIALMGGVWGFRGTNEHGGKVILLDWEHVALNGRTVYVAYDSDLANKRNVELAMKALWTFLRSRQAIPACIQWPEDYQQKKWGVDDFLADNKTLDDLLAMVPPIGPLPATAPHQNSGTAPWHAQLLLNQRGQPHENLSNLLVILDRHPDWAGHFWWDTVRAQPMHGDTPIGDGVIMEIARWLGLTMRMSVRSPRLLEQAVRTLCQQESRDLLAEWLLALPQWDRVDRLTEWLADVASITKDAYGMELSRLMPVSMVARALKPGIQYRYVIIFEGAEDSGKSKLVKTFASPEWYREYAVSMESKEAHMLLQGAWVAELGELASLSRTEEAKLKSFITLEEDVWIPKYSNFVHHVPRRTIFIGTVNPEDEYLKGQTGNTRFLPIKTGVIDCTLLEGMREQLFAEALVYYKDHPADWWQLSAEAESQAVIHREARRQSSIFEADLADWLDYRRFNQEQTCLPGETTWAEIAQYYLMIDKEKWKDKALQGQIAQALRANGWESARRREDGKRYRFWQKRPGQP